jgi:catechol 2,3-dioxygenase
VGRDGRSCRHAIEIALDDYQRTLDYLTERGLRPNTATHPWIGWRSIYVSDPDNHTVEFVCYDASTFRRE